MIPAWVSEIDFAVVDDRVAPVSNIDRAVGAHFYIDWPEDIRLALDDVRELLGSEAGAVVTQVEAANAAGAEIVGEQKTLPICRQSAAAHDLAAGVLRTSGIQARQHFGRAGVREILRAGDAVVD